MDIECSAVHLRMPVSVKTPVGGNNNKEMLTATESLSLQKMSANFRVAKVVGLGFEARVRGYFCGEKFRY